MEATVTRSPRRLRLERVLAACDRFAAWGSAALLVLYVVSGYGLTRAEHVTRLTGGVVGREMAFKLHNNLYIPLLILFAFHTFMGLRRALIRTTRRRALAGWIAVGTGAIVVAYLAVLGFA